MYTYTGVSGWLNSIEVIIGADEGDQFFRTSGIEEFKRQDETRF